MAQNPQVVLMILCPEDKPTPYFTKNLSIHKEITDTFIDTTRKMNIIKHR